MLERKRRSKPQEQGPLCKQRQGNTGVVTHKTNMSTPISAVALNLWVLTPLRAKGFLHRGHTSDILHIRCLHFDL